MRLACIYCVEFIFITCSELLAPDGKFLEENETLKRPLYADTLEMISWNGADWFYDSDFMREMVDELREDYGSILTEKDFMEYTAVERRAVQSYHAGFGVRGVAPPSGGVVLGLILNILDSKNAYCVCFNLKNALTEYKFTSDDFGDLSYHRIVEAFKFTYSQRLRLGDPAFNDTVQDVSMVQ